jgi:hypothetical protein
LVTTVNSAVYKKKTKQKNKVMEIAMQAHSLSFVFLDDAMGGFD